MPCCSGALAEDMYRLKSEMVNEQKKVKFYQAMLERTQEELESIQVVYFHCFFINFAILIDNVTCTWNHYDTSIARSILNLVSIELSRYLL